MPTLEKGVIEVERADLVGEHIWPHGAAHEGADQESPGGILFIDGFHSLSRRRGRISVKSASIAREGHGGQIKETVFILAGYPMEMEQFLRSNPGLRSRFPIHLEFPDYSAEELMQIAEVMLRKREYRLSLEASSMLERIIREKRDVEPVPSNARMVRNLIEKAIRRQAVRLIKDRTLPGKTW